MLYLINYNNSSAIVRVVTKGRYEYRAVVVATNKKELINRQLYVTDRELFMRVCPDYKSRLKYQAYA